MHHEGVTYPEGASVPVQEGDDLAAYWLKADWIEPIPTKTARKG